MKRQEQTFNPPVFMAHVSRVNGLDLIEEDGFICPEGSVTDGWEAHYVLDKEFLDLLKKRQPLYIYGTLPDDLRNGKEG